jgi:hypothetical protein
MGEDGVAVAGGREEELEKEKNGKRDSLQTRTERDSATGRHAVSLAQGHWKIENGKLKMGKKNGVPSLDA